MERCHDRIKSTRNESTKINKQEKRLFIFSANKVKFMNKINWKFIQKSYSTF